MFGMLGTYPLNGASTGTQSTSRREVLNLINAASHRGKVVAYSFDAHESSGEKGYKYLYVAIKDDTTGDVAPFVAKYKFQKVYPSQRKSSAISFSGAVLKILRPDLFEGEPARYSLTVYSLSDNARHSWKCFPQKILDVLTPTTDANETAWREACAKENAIRSESRKRYKELFGTNALV